MQNRFMRDDLIAITLLSRTEARCCKDFIPHTDFFWLRSRNRNGDACAMVTAGIISGYPVISPLQVRPAFVVDEHLEIGQKVFVGKLCCTVVAKKMALSDTAVCRHVWDGCDAETWEESDLYQFLQSDEFAKIIF